MRERLGTESSKSRLIDVFHLTADSSNCNKAINLDGDFGVASILFKYELSCANKSTCQPVTNTSLADCSKISKIHENICIIKCVHNLYA